MLNIYTLSFYFLSINSFMGIVNNPKAILENMDEYILLSVACGFLIYKKTNFTQTNKVQMIAICYTLYSLLNRFSVHGLYLANVHKFILDFIYYYAIFHLIFETYIEYMLGTYPQISQMVEEIIIGVAHDSQRPRNYKVEFYGLVLASIGRIIITDELFEELCPLVLESSGGNCSICLGVLNDEKKMRKLPCNHIFHVECIDPWILKCGHYTCPLCRREISQ